MQQIHPSTLALQLRPIYCLTTPVIVQCMATKGLATCQRKQTVQQLTRIPVCTSIAAAPCAKYVRTACHPGRQQSRSPLLLLLPLLHPETQHDVTSSVLPYTVLLCACWQLLCAHPTHPDTHPSHADAPPHGPPSRAPWALLAMHGRPALQPLLRLLRIRLAVQSAPWRSLACNCCITTVTPAPAVNENGRERDRPNQQPTRRNCPAPPAPHSSVPP